MNFTSPKGYLSIDDALTMLIGHIFGARAVVPIEIFEDPKGKLVQVQNGAVLDDAANAERAASIEFAKLILLEDLQTGRIGGYVLNPSALRLSISYWGSGSLGTEAIERGRVHADEGGGAVYLDQSEFSHWLNSITVHHGEPRESVVVAGGDTAPLKTASKNKIHECITAIYDEAEAAGRKPPNINECGAVVQKRLRDSGFEASQLCIKALADEPQYKSRRGRVGKHAS